MLKSKFFEPSPESYFGRSRWSIFFAVLLVFGLGIGLRLFDLTDLPLDFHPVRQLRSAVIARGMYYQMLPDADPDTRKLAITLWESHENLEPQIFERLVALTYLVTCGEHLWIARLYSILFWSAGGLALFLLARKMTNIDGAVVAAAYYFFLPFGVQASRSFQPDILMVACVLIGTYALYCWAEAGAWKPAIFAGLFFGLAILFKTQAAFWILPVLAFVILSSHSVRAAVADKKVWAVGALVVLPYILNYVSNLEKQNGADWFNFFVVRYIHQLADPTFYLQWIHHLSTWQNLTAVVLAVAGCFLLPKLGRATALGLLVGYGLIGIVFSYHTNTHDYYSIPLIPATALGLAPLAALFFSHLRQQPRFWQIAFAAVFLFAIGYPAVMARGILIGADYRMEAGGWRRIGENVPKDGQVIGLTHDNGVRLQYFGWIPIANWPAEEGEIADFERVFAERTAGRRYFLVTLTGDLDRQPALKQMLYENYALVLDKGSYILFDLEQAP